MRLQEFRDNLKNLQLLWTELLDTEDIEYLYVVLEAYMHRLGVFAARAHPADLLDDPENVDVVREPTNIHPEAIHRLSASYIRSCIAFLLVAYRSLALADVAVDLEPEEPKVELHRHLLSAAMDSYFNLSMRYDTPVGATMQYMFDFFGLFNSQAQVLFYHVPSYVRRPQKSFEEISDGNMPLNLFPLYLQIHPQIPVLFEESPLPKQCAIPSKNPDSSPRPPGETDHTKWAFMVVPGRIYAYHLTTGYVYQSTKNIHAMFNAVEGC